MTWTRKDTIRLANGACVRCHGSGLVASSERYLRHPSQPCVCVLRAIFRECFDKFREFASQEPPIRRAIGWGRKNEEYMADFVAIAKRTLSEDLHRVFRIHFLLGASAELCISRLQLDRVRFYHAVGQVELALGRAFRETQPYALYPVDEYFADPPEAR